MKPVLVAVLAAAFVAPAQLVWGATTCYTFHNLSAADVYVAAHDSLSAKRNGLGGWDIVERSDDERSFAFQSFYGLNAESWRGVSGKIVVKQTRRGAVLVVTTQRKELSQRRPERPDTDACLVTVQVVRHLGFKEPIRCDQPCPNE